ncbi:hypothetical protein VTH06DRAFT_7689 [Thermothelomyces fergusii]
MQVQSTRSRPPVGCAEKRARRPYRPKHLGLYRVSRHRAAIFISGAAAVVPLLRKWPGCTDKNMAKTLFQLVSSAAAFSAVLGHAVVTVPTPRRAGPYYTQRCGEAYAVYMEKDKTGPIENGVARAGSELGCNPFLCRGYQYEDNGAVEYKPGQVVSFHVDLVAGHRPGYANVSVVDLQANKIIGDPLKFWDDFPLPLSETLDFDVTIPDTLGTACSTGGKCAIQWYWYASGNKQTYESCVDFYVRA